ncbi:hypothetical protein RIEGSTA812A_PEG_1303 [invertebrate metagenome]|uniref:Uncharacterized protein n=1 Tax=invertebrate metagenome TaxID=1711999 RepID=A0A484H847_9ZZZZ
MVAPHETRLFDTPLTLALWDSSLWNQRHKPLFGCGNRRSDAA